MSRVRAHAGVGAPSIILIIVVLSLTTFGVLTLVSARADGVLAARAAVTAEAYYAADAAAQKRLMELDEALQSGAAMDEIGFLAPDADMPGAYTFRCETGDGRAISVSVRGANGAARFTVLSYRLIQLTDWDAQENLLLASTEQ